MQPDLQFQLDQVARALDKKDYRSATQRLKLLWQENPENPWVQMYRARLYEAAQKFDQAETIYRHLLRDAMSPKVALQARQGLQRIQETEQAQRKAALAASKASSPEPGEPGLLVLESIPPTARQSAAQHMAKVMELDPYTARMQIPNRGWRLYRLGDLGEMKFYGEQIRSGNIPAFWVATKKVKSLPIYQVQSIQEITPQAVVICENPAGQVGELVFDWSEVTQRVDGSLPVMAQVVNIDVLRDRTDGRNGKEETLDYLRVCDLHLPKRNCILRFCDGTYDYQDGLLLADEGSWDQYSTRMQWNSLMATLTEQAPQMQVWSDFTPFGEFVMDFPVLLHQMNPELKVYNQTESLWPSAFHLYSGLAFWRDRD
ncbi:tetratricopeptide repeat protein [filamentous cyanobacterium LEGE 11480]|uniref:Tetratricopeptide repeat protein n=1 Tax=Romeriopsis navalis LEGE 11480 TaxID=2777977 RepID=A0A928VRD8_9CYAN|nr:tetratricopeptide repeat protein [Romeriopsis navalis]MBE9032352.1 tetratricopeptide repeat protein [Romeriopsis navalis LEGE 11480]